MGLLSFYQLILTSLLPPRSLLYLFVTLEIAINDYLIFADLTNQKYAEA